MTQMEKLDAAERSAAHKPAQSGLSDSKADGGHG